VGVITDSIWLLVIMNAKS